MQAFQYFMYQQLDKPCYQSQPFEAKGWISPYLMQNQGIHSVISARSYQATLCLSVSLSLSMPSSPSSYQLLSSVSRIHSFGRDCSVSVYKHYPSKTHSCKLQIHRPFISLYSSIYPSSLRLLSIHHDNSNALLNSYTSGFCQWHVPILQRR